jgi:hypothetical protein
VRAGEHLDGGGEVCVSKVATVVVAVGPHQVGEHLGVAGVGLGAGDSVALTVAGGGQGVDDVHLVSGGDQELRKQSVGGLDETAKYTWAGL